MNAENRPTQPQLPKPDKSGIKGMGGAKLPKSGIVIRR